MAKILIVDYLGQCDKEGKPVGHAIKTIEQYGLLLKSNNDVDVLLTNNYVSKIEKEYFSKIIALEKIIKSGKTGLMESISRIYNRIYNLFKVSEMKGYDLIIFVNIDFSLGLFSRRLSKNSNFATISYMDSYKFGSFLSKKIKNFLFNRVFKYSKGNITSNEKLATNRKHTLLIPDFLYIPEIYDKYRNKKKEKCFLCIGTLSYEKDIQCIVEVFMNREEKLIIVGRFYDINLYNKLTQIKTPNIIIENRIVDYNEYYELIATSQYVILPYRKEFYDGRSSGVLLETVFLDSIPIAPDFLLESNYIEGISYMNKEDLKSKIDNMFGEKAHNLNNIKKYNLNDNKEKLNNFIKDIL